MAILSRHRAMQLRVMQGLESLDLAEEEEEGHIDVEEAKGKLN
jgi:hypothetical protein